MQWADDGNLLVVPATGADDGLAELVAHGLSQRIGKTVALMPLLQLTRQQRPLALVLMGHSAGLQPVLDTLAGKEWQELRAGMTLVHPEPDARLETLVRRHGLSGVVRWPHDLEFWCSTSPRLTAGSPRIEQLAALRCMDDSDAMADMQLLGRSPGMLRLKQRIRRIAAFDSNVLLVGETGTGKERVAEAVHRLSPRSAMPMVSLNCAALPEHLIESELFGYERGAFTGALAAYAGKFGLAEGGTLFLDEIGEMPRAAQAKILRVIESREYYRLGGTRPQKANVRLIAATHRDLEALCASSDFRLDLYYRLNVARLELPPLRERAEDILPLAVHFLQESSKRMKQKAVPLSAGVKQALCAYAWPGNVRELRNAMEIALINNETGTIELQDLPSHLTRWLETPLSMPDERELLVSTLQQVQWNKSEAARVLNWSRMKLYRKLHHYALLGLQDSPD